MRKILITFLLFVMVLALVAASVVGLLLLLVKKVLAVPADLSAGLYKWWVKVVRKIVVGLPGSPESSEKVKTVGTVTTDANI